MCRLIQIICFYDVGSEVLELKIHPNHLENLFFPHSDIPPKVLNQQMEDDRDFALLTSAQVMLMLLFQGPHFDKHCSKHLMFPIPHFTLEQSACVDLTQESIHVGGGGGKDANSRCFKYRYQVDANVIAVFAIHFNLLTEITFAPT